MDQVITWAALFAAGATIIALITFWVNRGKVEGELETKANNAAVTASTAIAKAELVAQALSEVRVDIAEKLQQYATHRDLAAAEVRLSQSMDGLRSELRGVNQRLDRLLDRNSKSTDGS